MRAHPATLSGRCFEAILAVITIRTDRLLIRNFRQADWRELQELVIRYQASEYAQYDHRWPIASEEVARIAGWFASGDRYLAVCIEGTGELIGLVAMSPSAAHEELSLGYVFHLDYQGQAFATEACRAVIDSAFNSGTTTRIVAHTAVANEPSCRLLRRLGMEETGRSTAALQVTEGGVPIEFLGVSFAITRAGWAHLERAGGA
jgi:ribosomal-protein-alanine N-acetyltransferase